jgi:hypothetical protein
LVVVEELRIRRVEVKEDVVVVVEDSRRNLAEEA